MRRIRRACALTLVALLGMAIAASAQVTTGSVSGTVHDAQGGVIPGASVVLISESRGTRSEPAITESDRGLRVPERLRGHLHG